MKKTSWLLFFLSLLIPSGVSAQTQDIHALSVVTRAFEKAKEDNKTRQDTVVARKTHAIDNLGIDGKFKSMEKLMVYKVYAKDKGKKKEKEYVEELIDIWPRKAEPASNPIDFNKLIDAFFSRYYFLLSPEIEIIDGRSCYRIHFWPREDLLPEKERMDYILNRVTGIIYIDEKTYELKKINGRLTERISKMFFFNMNLFDFDIEFRNWKGLGLLSKMNTTTRYEYWDWIRIVKRYQTHTFWYEYGIE